MRITNEIRSGCAGQLCLTDDLVIHLIELPKFTRTLEELRTPLDSWLYFFKNGAGLDADALPEAMNRPEQRKAMGVLKMLAQSDVERELREESGTGSLTGGGKKAGPLIFRPFLPGGSFVAGAAREGLLPAPIGSRFSPPTTGCRTVARAGCSVGWPRSRTRAASD